MKSKTATVILFAILSTFALQSQCSLQGQSIVEFETNQGNITIELFDTTAPISVNNFLGYVNRGDYDGTIFHRSIFPNADIPRNISVIQGGGFDSNFNAIATQAPIPNEFLATNSNIRGTIAFARNSILNSATSQFFFNIADNSQALDSQSFTVFGEVISSFDVIDSINQLDTVDAGAPFEDLPVLDSGPFIASGQATSDDVVIISNATVTFAIPEPTSAAVVALGGMIGAVRRRRVL